MSRPFDETLLKKLVCPVTRARLHYHRESQELVSEEAGVAYPIRDGVAVMLIEEARPLGRSEPLDGNAAQEQG